MCPPKYRRRELMMISRMEDPRMMAIEEEMMMLKADDAMLEEKVAMTKLEYEKELYYMGLSNTKAAKELSFSKIYDYEYERAKTAGFFVEKFDEKGAKYF